MLQHLKEESNISIDNKEMIPFRDEKGTMRLSIKFSDLLYLQAADNYVNIFYCNREKIARYMLRSSLKLIEDEHKSFPLVRCHRSFMVNFEKVKIIRREKDGLHLELDSPENLELPISKTYLQEVFKGFDQNIS
jgi:DNA-binding LytR/AlgR family response regulator